jgi:lysophospholipase L1-like esterase
MRPESQRATGLGASPRLSPWNRRIGFLVVGLGFAVNHWMIGWLFSGDGSIGWIGYMIPVWILQSLLIGSGLYLVSRNPLAVGSDLMRAALMAAAMLIALGISEAFLRVSVSGPLFHPDLPLYPHRKLTLTPNLPGVSDTVTVTTNKWGLRGDPISNDWADRTTILAIGGSTTKCSFLSDDKTWPARLQQLLQTTQPTITVQNAGLSGHTTRGHLLLMERVALHIKPDMVVFLVGLNDMHLSLHRSEVDRGERSPGLHYTVFASSRVLQFLYGWYRVLVDRLPAEELTQRSDVDEIIELKPLSAEAPLPSDLTLMLPSLDLFERNLTSLIGTAKAHNMSPVFLTQPILYGDSEKWTRIQGESFWLRDQRLSVSAATYRRMLDIFNRRLLDVCRQHSVPCIDLASSIPTDQEFFYDSMHFTERGAELVAQNVFRHMVDNRLIPENRH